MEGDSWFVPILFILLLGLSAFFSGSESAFFSLTISDIRRLREEKKDSRKKTRILELLENPKRLLTSILFGNTIVNVAAATVAALFTHQFSPFPSLPHVQLLLEIVVVTGCILLFSEILPKIIAVKSAIVFAEWASLPLKIMTVILWPISVILVQFSKQVCQLLGIKKELPFVNEDEIKTLIEVGEEKGTLDSAEREMIHSIFEFGETIAREIMIPRMDMLALEQETPLEEVLDLIREKGHSRIPVYQETADHIVGILFVKDLLPYMQNGHKFPPLRDLVRDAYFVPESKPIDELLKVFQKERTHMAIVVDEYGGTAGLITLEDIIEEIVGDIRDEYDREAPLVKKVNKNTWIVDGKIDIEDFNEILNLNIPCEEDYESLGGFIFQQSGRIPNENDVVDYEGIKLIVEKVHHNRVKKVRVVLPMESENALPEDKTG